MNKIWLVSMREYVTRVKNKTFILTTLLTPIGFALFLLIVGFVMSRGSDDKKDISIYDPTNLLNGELSLRKNITYHFDSSAIATQIEAYNAGKNNGVLEILPLQDSLAENYSIIFHSDDQLALDESSSIEDAVATKIRNYKLKKLNIDDNTVKKLDTRVNIEPKTVKSEKNITSMTTIIASVIGAIVGYAMFFVILIYGSQVMRSVMEEKINRIVEVLISSVKPFQLMMGKVIGVGMVGLTQVGIWMVLMPILFLLVSTIVGIDTESLTSMQGQMPTTMPMPDAELNKLTSVINEISGLNWALIVPFSIFYFIAGYFAYAALFAAIGSAVGEDVNEAQSLTFPVMLPLLFGFYIGISAMNSPNSSLVVWASMIPLLSSVVMPVRLPFDPPMWQIIVSVISLIIFSVFLVWIAGRIYRVGILMYGKKASIKELTKWIFYKI